jgi:hypothetical protein
MYIGGALTATAIYGTFNGTLGGNVSAATANTATNIAGGLKNQIPYQSAVGITTFNSGLTFDGTTFTATNIIVPGVTNATSTVTGALQVAGGLAVGKDLYIGGTLTIAGSSGGDIDMGGGDILGVGRITANTGTFTTTNISSTIGVTSTNTGALQVAGGVGVGGGMYVGGVITATNLFVGPYAVSTASALAIQSLGVGQGNAGTINFSTGLSASVSANVATVTLTTSTLMTTAVNLAGGSQGQIHYQTAAGATAFANSGTTGQFLQATTNGAPSFTSTASMYVGNAAIANILNPGNTSTQQVGYAANLLGNGAGNGALVYQSAANTTAFLAQGTAGWLLVSQGAGSAPAFTTTGSIYVNSAVNAETLRGGSAGSLPYQSAAGVTTFLAGGAAQQHLVYGTGNTLVWQSTSTFSGGTASATGVANQSVTITSGGLGVTGDSYFSAGLKTAGSLIAGSTSADTGTNTSNSLYVAGGAWVDKTLVVGGDTTFRGTVTFNGTATYNLSTNTYYTDNIIEMHVPPTGVYGQWSVDDGKDIGFRFHYYAGADNNAALVLANDSKYLEWYETGAEGTGGTFNTATYGTFQTGRVFLKSTEGVLNTQTGALRVAGGVGIGGGLVVGGTVTATTFIGAFSGTASKANNIVGGTAGQIVYQSATDTTGFVGPGTAGQLLVSAGASAPTYTSTGSIYVNSAVNAETLRGGTAGQLTYQSSPGVTGFVGPGTTGQILVSAGTSAPTYTSTGSIYVGNAAVANILNAGNTSTQQVGFAANVLAGSQGQIAYQSAANTTAFVNSGTTGQFLQATTNGAPAFTSTGSMYVNSAVYAEEIRGGTAGQLLYQSAPSTTDYVGPGTAGQILVSGGAAIPVYTSTGSIYVNSAVNSNNIIGGAKDQIPYQSAAGATTFGSGLTFNGTTFTATNIVVPGTTNATSTVTGALQVAGGIGVGGNVISSGYGKFTGAYDEVASTTTVALYLGVAGSTPASPRIGFANSGTTWQIDNYNGNFRWYTPFGTKMQIDINGNLSVYSNTSTNSTTTGALVVTGGVGVGGGMYVGGVVTATNFFVGPYAVSTASALAIQSLGVGQGNAGTINFSTGLSASVSSNVATVTLTTSTLMTTAVNLAGGSANQFAYQTAAGATAFASTASMYVGNAVNSQNLLGGTTGQFAYQSAANTTAFVSTGSMYVNGAVSAQNLFGGTTGQFAYQTAAGATAFASTGSMYVGNAAVANILNPGNTSTQQVGFAKNLLGNGAGNGALVYQSAPDTTAFLAQGTAGWLLVSQGAGSAPAFTTTGSIYVNSAVNANNIIGGATNQIPYQSAAGATTFGSGLTYNGTTLATGNVSVTGNTNASSTTTGAFQVVGGAGIGGNLFVGGSAYLAGDLYVDGTSFTVNSNSIATGDKTLTLSTGSGSAALAAGSGLQIGTTSTPYASWLYDGSAYWVSAGSNAGGIKVSATTGVTSTNTGALVVVGGAGFGGNLFVGGVVTATSFVGALAGTAALATTATNLAGGTANQFAYQTAPGTTAFASTASMYVGNAVNSQNLLGGTTGQFAYQSAANTTAFVSTGSMYVNGAVSAQNLFGGTTGQFAYQTAAGATAFVSTSSMYVDSSVKSNNIIGGSAGSLPYQTGASTTAFLAGGTAQQHLVYGTGNAPVWQSTSTFSGGTASSSTVASQSVNITGGGLGVTGASYFSTDVGMGGELNVAGHIVGGGVRSSSTSTVPANATVGDIWYNTSNDTMYRYTNDGTTSYWVDINGPAIANGSAAYMTLAAFKAVVAASSSFLDFQSRVAAL